MDQAELEQEADRALAAGHLQRAVELLEQAARSAGPEPGVLLKLAGLQRAAGNLDQALGTVHRALVIAPRDFMALLMRASLLDRLADPDAGEAWSHALAQRPQGELPGHLASVIEQGERHEAAWIEARDLRMSAAMQMVAASPSEEESHRINRFRSNILRRTRHYHSEPTSFHFPGLTELEFHPRSRFDWLAEVEASADVLVAELEAVMAAERAELVPYIQYDAHLPMDQWRPLNHSLDWTAIHLLQNGERIEANARHCPQAMGLLEKVGQPDIRGASPNAMFSLLAPGTAIPPHVGVSNARLVCHLPLVVPEGCWFRVGAETRYWKRGEAFLFDDTIEHEALNPSGELRVVFIFDVWHPDLTAAEREAVAVLIGSEGGAGAL